MLSSDAIIRAEILRKNYLNNIRNKEGDKKKFSITPLLSNSYIRSAGSYNINRAWNFNKQSINPPNTQGYQVSSKTNPTDRLLQRPVQGRACIRRAVNTWCRNSFQGNCCPKQLCLVTRGELRPRVHTSSHVHSPALNANVLRERESNPSVSDSRASMHTQACWCYLFAHIRINSHQVSMYANLNVTDVRLSRDWISQCD